MHASGRVQGPSHGGSFFIWLTLQRGSITFFIWLALQRGSITMFMFPQIYFYMNVCSKVHRMIISILRLDECVAYKVV